ncbi:MAG: hypothetical protein ACP5U0_09830 [Caldisphaera sp.]
MTTFTIQEFPTELILSLPFKQIAENAKKTREPLWREIKAEIEKIAFDNKEAIIDLLSNSIIKAITEEISLGKVSEGTMKEVTSKIEYLNDKFKYINKYFESLDPYVQRSLLTPFLDDECSSLARYKENFATLVASKEKWDLNDSLIYSYYLLYEETINVWRILLKRASRDTIKSKLNIIKSLMFFYKPIILTYVLGKQIPNEVLVKKLAELRASINPRGIFPIAPKIYEVLEAISTVPPI